MHVLAYPSVHAFISIYVISTSAGRKRCALVVGSSRTLDQSQVHLVLVCMALPFWGFMVYLLQDLGVSSTEDPLREVSGLRV